MKILFIHCESHVGIAGGRLSNTMPIKIQGEPKAPGGIYFSRNEIGTSLGFTQGLKPQDIFVKCEGSIDIGHGNVYMINALDHLSSPTNHKEAGVIPMRVKKSLFF